MAHGKLALINNTVVSFPHLPFYPRAYVFLFLSFPDFLFAFSLPCPFSTRCLPNKPPLSLSTLPTFFFNANRENQPSTRDHQWIRKEKIIFLIGACEAGCHSTRLVEPPTPTRRLTHFMSLLFYLDVQLQRIQQAVDTYGFSFGFFSSLSSPRSQGRPAAQGGEVVIHLRPSVCTVIPSFQAVLEGNRRG